MWRGSVWRCPTPADLKSFLHPREVNRRLQDLRSCLSPKQRQGQDHQSQDDEVVLLEGPVLPRSPRLFPLKIRCRADLVRLPLGVVSAGRTCRRRPPGTACGEAACGVCAEGTVSSFARLLSGPAQRPFRPPCLCAHYFMCPYRHPYSRLSCWHIFHPFFTAPCRHPKKLCLVAPSPGYVPLFLSLGPCASLLLNALNVLNARIALNTQMFPSHSELPHLPSKDCYFCGDDCIQKYD